jgi:hypothetical protein
MAQISSWVFSIAPVFARSVLWLLSCTPSERVALFAAFLVLVGVIGEEIAEHKLFKKGQRARLREMVKRTAVGVLLLGLAGDVVGIVMGQAEMTALTKEAGDAKQSAQNAAGAAGKAQRSADASNGAAGEAQREADSVDAEASRISERLKEEVATMNAIEPRSFLLNSASASMTKNLTRFAGQHVVVELCGFIPPTPQDGDILHISPEFFEKDDAWGSMFHILVEHAKWGSKYDSLKIWNKCNLGPGITAFFNLSGSLTTKEAASALAGELKRILPHQGPPFLAPGTSDVGLPPIDPDAPWTLIAKDPNLIVVAVGDQPEPYPRNAATRTTSKPGVKP